jgi:glutamyl-tRNA synthetase
VEKAGFFFHSEIQYEHDQLIAKGLTAAQSLAILTDCQAILNGLEVISPLTAEEPLREYVEGSGYKPGQVFGILRVAVTGQVVSPPLFESMEIIGKKAVMERIESAMKFLQELV